MVGRRAYCSLLYAAVFATDDSHIYTRVRTYSFYHNYRVYVPRMRTVSVKLIYTKCHLSSSSSFPLLPLSSPHLFPHSLSHTLPLYSQYVGCTLVVSPTYSTAKAVELAKSIVKKCRKTNKRRVTLTFTAETIYISDMIYRVSM